MELTVVDRLMLGALLGPIAADVVTLRIVRNLQDEIGFSEEETEVLKFHPGMKKNPVTGEEEEDGRILWDKDAPQTKEFEFKPAALRIIVEQLEKASATKTLTLTQLDLYTKFCPEEEEEEEV